MRALVTGATSGIGWETVKYLTDSGWKVLAVGRRASKLKQLAKETGCDIVVADLAKEEDLENIVKKISTFESLEALVNIAGLALGLDTIAEGKKADWETMFKVNVFGTWQLTQKCLPYLRKHKTGTVLCVTSTAAFTPYEGGGGYVASKYAQKALINTLRLEEAENNIRVIEILPGMVKTEEFSLNRFKGNETAANKVYSGVSKPLLAEDIANIITFSLNLPHHINIDQLVVRPVAQAAQHKVIRN